MASRELTGKAVVVTGAGRRQGLGAGIARRFLAEGANVVLADIAGPSGTQFPEHGVATRSELSELVEDLQTSVAQRTGQVLGQTCDVRDEAQVERLVDFCVDAFGGIDVLVNNAGVGYLMAPVVDVSRDDWDVVLGVNLTGTYLCTKHAARRMIDAGRGGRIVNISSQGGKSGFPHASAYVASKHGVIGFTRSVAIELGAHAITVNAVCPNHVTTGLGSWQNEYFARLTGAKDVDEYLAAMRSRIPLGRHGTAQDVAAACVWLAGDDAAYITGESLNVSGGEEVH